MMAVVADPEALPLPADDQHLRRRSRRTRGATVAGQAEATATAAAATVPRRRNQDFFGGGSVITGDDVLDYRTAPPFSIVLSPTPTKPTAADGDVVRRAVQKAVGDSLLEQARKNGGGGGGGDDVTVEFELGSLVEMTFAEDGGGGRRALRRRVLSSTADGTSSSTSTGNGGRRAQASSYTVVGFDESRVTYRAPLLSDFTPPSQNAFESETLVSVMSDAVQRLPAEIRAANTEGGVGALSGLADATADLTYVPPPPGTPIQQQPDNEENETQEQELESSPPEEIEQPEPEPEKEPQPEPEQEKEEEEEEEETLIFPKDEVDEEEEEEEEVQADPEENVEEPEPQNEEEKIVLEPAQEEQQEQETVQPESVDESPETSTGPPQEQVLEPDQDDEEDEAVLAVPVPPEAAPGPTTTPGVTDATGDSAAAEDADATAAGVPPPTFGAGDYTGQTTVSSIGTVEGGGTRGAAGGANTGAIVGSVLAVLACAILAIALLVRRRSKRKASRQGKFMDGGELVAKERTFDLDDDGELTLNGLHVQPANDDRPGNDEDEDEDEEDKTGGYLPVALRSRSFPGRRSAAHNTTPAKSKPRSNHRNDDDEDDNDSVSTDWSGGPSVNSLGHSIQGSVADSHDHEADLSNAYKMSKSAESSNLVEVFKKKKKQKQAKRAKSKSVDLSSPPRLVRTESFEHHRNAAGISLRKDMMCTVDSSGAFPMNERSRSADHGNGFGFGASMSSGPEAGWIWGSRNEADMKPRKDYGGEKMEVL